MNDVTADDIDKYIEYSKIIYSKIVMEFSPKAQVEDSDMMAKYMNQAMWMTMMAGIVDKLFNNILMPFDEWMRQDCIFTGHKKRW